MHRTATPRDLVRRTSLVALLVFLTTYAIAVVYMQQLAASNGWITGEWLINYSNGFVRRGLIGEICRQLYYLGGFNPVSVVAALKAFLYATLCASFFVLAARKTIGLIELAIIVSPSAFAFELNDPLGSGRKELALLAVFIVFVVADNLRPSTGRAVHKQWQFWYLLVSLPILTLIHEGLFFFFPFLLAYAWLKDDRLENSALVFGLPYTVAAAAFVLCYAFRGGAGISDAMCASLTAMSLDQGLCHGAIGALERYDVHVRSDDVARCVFLVLLSFGPLLWYAAKALTPSRRHLFVVGTCVAAVATAPLYVVSEDWGRWIHITAMLVIVTVLACKDSTVRLQARHPAFAVAYAAALSVYVVSWELPHWIHSAIPILKSVR
jgi:hypothetical protein